MPTFDRDDVLAAMQGRFTDFYSQYGPLRPSGGEMRGACPIHGGQRDSFAVDAEGRWFCHSECSAGGDVFDFLSRKEGLDFPDALAVVAGWSGTASSSSSTLSSSASPSLSGFAKPTRPARRTIKTYDYNDENGVLLFQVVRYEPKGFSQRRPADGKEASEGQWVYSLSGVRRVLYRLPEVAAAAASGKPVYVCEGEKDADALAAMGLCATTAPMGAKKWDEGYTEALCGAGVVILPDNDRDGQEHARIVAEALHGKAKRVRVVMLPGLPEKGDVSDWLASGGTKETLLSVVRETPDWMPEEQSAQPSAEDIIEQPAVNVTASDPLPRSNKHLTSTSSHTRKPMSERVVDLADVAPPTDLPLLFGQYLMKGAAHWLTGQTGLGKSTLLYNISCALAEGTPLWGIECQPTRILYCDMESGDVGRAHKVERLYQGSPRVRGQLLFLREPVKLPEELPELLAFVQQQEIGLVIFDTARRVFSVKDENDNAEVYNRVIPTLDALKAAGIATLTLGHPSKNGNGSARGAGAQEDAGDVNLSLTMHRGEVSDADAVIALRVTKNRLLGLGIPPLYLRRTGGDQFERIEVGEALPQEEPISKHLQCRQFLTDAMRESTTPISHKALLNQAEASGFTKATFQRAFKSLKDEGDVEVAQDGGYTLADPFAD